MLSRFGVFNIAVLSIALLHPTLAGAAGESSVTLVIDNLTTQPVGTGLIAASGDTWIVFHQGAESIGDVIGHEYSDGWFGSNGMVRLRRVGQPRPDLPYGAVLGTFGTSLAFSNFYADTGVHTTVTNDLGRELKFGVNMSDSDLAAMDVQVVITVIQVPASTAVEDSLVIIDNTTTQPVGTGIVGASGKNFVLIPHGSLRLISRPYTDGWFGPEGLTRLFRNGQPVSSMQFGCVMGTYTSSLEQGFVIGDGGFMKSQTNDFGNELKIGVNMSDADLANTEGQFQVAVIAFPEGTSGIGSPGQSPQAGLRLGQSHPNPMHLSPTRIAYATEVPGRTLIRVYNAGGRFVRTLVDRNLQPGEYEATWDGTDTHGQRVASGTYFYQISTPSGSHTQKLSVH